MVGRVDEETPTAGHVRRQLGFNVKVWFDTPPPLPVRVMVMLANGKENLVKFVFEKLPKFFCLNCYTIKHATESYPWNDHL